jgi:hypothetical protein
MERNHIYDRNTSFSKNKNKNMNKTVSKYHKNTQDEAMQTR